MAHRCSTALEMAWEATTKVCPEFNQMINSISDLRSFIARRGGIQEFLPKTIKKNSATRPWRSYYTINDSGKSNF
jgi:hypothetical protein